MDATKFIEAVAELSEAKGLSHDAIIFALQEAIKRAYIKFLGGGDDAVVTCTIDEANGNIELAQIKKVVEEVEDDYLEISVEEANEGRAKPKYAAGDDYAIACPIETLTKVTAMAVRNNLRQRLSEAERTMLYDIYKDHIGEMLTGIVEKADERSVTVKIDRTSIELSRKELIGDEYFRVGDPIKVYIQEVRSGETTADGKPARGPQIQATRSSEGFLKRLFEEEIHEIYDGTVLIKAIARQAGVRSKVAVASLNEDVDATGACIGQGGNRIQKIVSQLGNGKSKEKIDVINYSNNPGMFLIEAVRPAVAIGLNVYDDDHNAEILIEDGTLPLAYGKFKSNLSLARKITGYDIDFIEKSKAQELGLIFTSVEEWKAKAEAEKAEEERIKFAQKQQEEALKREAEKAAAAKEEPAPAPVVEEPAPEPEPEPMPEVVVKAPSPKADVRPEEFPASAVNPAAAALAADKAAREAAAAAKEEKARKAERPVQPTSVATTTTLDALEKELEEAKEKKTKSATRTKRPRKITEEEVPVETTVKPAVPTMPVYTEEELSQIEAEEAEPEYDADDYDEDYSDYDDYYDDDDRK